MQQQYLESSNYFWFDIKFKPSNKFKTKQSNLFCFQNTAKQPLKKKFKKTLKKIWWKEIKGCIFAPAYKQ